MIVTSMHTCPSFEIILKKHVFSTPYHQILTSMHASAVMFLKKCFINISQSLPTLIRLHWLPKDNAEF